MMRIALVLLVAVAACVCIHVAQALPVSYDKPSWTDVNKYEGNGDTDPLTNLFNDMDGDGQYDLGEPWGDDYDPLGTNPDSAADNSCWVATASNMLRHILGQNGITEQSAEDIYYEILTYPDHEWTEAGFEWDAIDEYMDSHGLEFNMRHWWDSDASWPEDPYEFLKEELYRCQSVGLGISWDGSGGHAVTLWGWTGSDLRLADSDDGATQLRNIDDGYPRAGDPWRINIGGVWGTIDSISVFCPEPSLAASLGLAIMLFALRRFPIRPHAGRRRGQRRSAH